MKYLVIICDLLLLNLLFGLSCHDMWGAGGYGLLQSHVVVSALYTIVALASGVVLHLRGVRRFQVAVNVLRIFFFFTLLTALAMGLCHFAHPRMLLYDAWLICSTMAVVAWRLTLRSWINRYRTSKEHIHNFVLVGATRSNTELLCNLIGHGEPDYHACGYFASKPLEGMPDVCPYLGSEDDVIGWLRQHGEVHELYLSLRTTQLAQTTDIIDYCDNHFIHFYAVPKLSDVRHYMSRMHPRLVGDTVCLSLHDEPLADMYNRFMKRAFDIAFSLAFLCTLFPVVFVIVAIITKATMPGPIFFRQKRTAIGDKEFYCLKFRSMRVNSQADTLQATKHDPRKTRWGDIMRKTNIDELPQFINVLMGDMSVVGPRPHMLKHTEEYSRIVNKYMVRHWVKPGITGWSQVTGYRGETRETWQMEERVKHDIWYIEHWTFQLDLYIIYKTIVNLLRGDRNAY